MKKTILSAVSVLAISLAGAAYAEDNVPNTGNVLTDAKAELKADWADAKVKADAKADVDANGTYNNAKANTEDTYENLKADTKDAYADAKAETKEAYKDAKATTKEAYHDVKAKLIGEGDAGSAPSALSVSERQSASGMIGKPVYNAKQEKVATVSDIIVDHNGRAQMVVVSDGGFAGIGDKLAAFDYGMVVSQNAEGDVFMPLTEDLLSKVAAFSYDRNDSSDKVRLIPADGYSVAELLKANLENQSGNKLAKVENITFDNGQADNIIVAFDEILGIGGDKAAFDFDDVQVIQKSADDISIRLNARQSAEFETYKNSMTN